MKHRWQLCEPGEKGGSRWNYLYAAINRRGEISFSRRTFEEMGSPERAVVMYDAGTNTIGVQPATNRAPSSFYLARHGRGGQARRIHALKLLLDFNIKVTHTLRFLDPKLDDGVLLLDLNATKAISNKR